MRFFVPLTAAILYLTLTTPAYADSHQVQASPEIFNIAQNLKKSFEKKCPSMVSGIAANKEESLSLETIESTKSICTCASDRTFSDTQIVKLLNGLEGMLKSPDKSEIAKQFLAKKVIASVFGCVSENLNEQLNNVNLEF